MNIDLKERGRWACFRVDLAQDKGKRRGLVSAVIKLPPPVFHKTQELLE